MIRAEDVAGGLAAVKAMRLSDREADRLKKPMDLCWLEMAEAELREGHPAELRGPIHGGYRADACGH
jgi:hypothetical protein